MILIDSTYINNGGGLVLLKYLITVLSKAKLNCHFLLDIRCKTMFNENIKGKVTFLNPTVINRHKYYKDNGDKYRKILSFNNIPPSYRTKAEVFTYFHNVSMFESYDKIRIKAKILAFLKLNFIKYFLKNTDWFIVQTENVKYNVAQNLNFNPEKIKVIPFFPELSVIQNFQTKNSNHFIYVSDGNPHKNHLNLIDAWEIVNKYKPEAKLFLTISDNYPSLLKIIKEKNLNITNIGFVNQEDLKNYYNNCGYLIYPSYMESFGLGLIEAASFQCNIIASDKPYVFEVVQPSLVFDPKNHVDIANKVLEVLKSKKVKKTTLHINNEIDLLIDFLK
jgi:glycosyltransferase involved in cell wall biosynthesis